MVSLHILIDDQKIYYWKAMAIKDADHQTLTLISIKTYFSQTLNSLII